jgi:hypothetical protein
MSVEAPARSVALTGGAIQTVLNGPGYYRGISLRETAGAVAVVRVWNNTAASGTLLAVIALVANASTDHYLAGEGVYAELGIVVEKVSGTFEGAIRIG